MNAQELRTKYLEFFKSKGHTVIPSASLVPENDPSVLFTTAGMHPLVPYLLGEKHPGGNKLVNVQKCIRTGDIDEVGDTTHHTFFEMLGNWSLGEYFKEDAIKMSWEFLTSPDWLDLDKNRIAVSVFEGDADSPFDQEAYDVWKSLGMSEKKIARLPKKNNWWGMDKGPCGPDTEIFYWVGNPNEIPESFNDDNDFWVEIWNNVFMQYDKQSDGTLKVLEQKNVDTGMGMERILAAVNGLDDNYKTELFWPIIKKIEELSKLEYGNKSDEEYIKDDKQCWVDVRKQFRIIADHIKAATFIIADGVVPSNTGQGYVLRRLIRRAVRYGKLIGIEKDFATSVAEIVVQEYSNHYPELAKNRALIFAELKNEEEKFRKTLDNGLKKLEKYLSNPEGNFWNKVKDEVLKQADIYFNDDIANLLFDLYQTNGFPIELAMEVVFEEFEKRDVILNKDKITQKFNKLFEQHQDLSRTASAGMFKGGLQDSGQESAKLHSATHLLLAALRNVLGDHVYQKGSNITPERLRLDFSHSEKMTPEQLVKVQELVNAEIQADLEIVREEMSLEDAKKIGAMGVFEAKYGEKVSVYSISDNGRIASKEICGGPHASRTGQLGHFRIQKEEASSAGVRRIKAVLE